MMNRPKNIKKYKGELLFLLTYSIVGLMSGSVCILSIASMIGIIGDVGIINQMAGVILGSLLFIIVVVGCRNTYAKIRSVRKEECHT